MLWRLAILLGVVFAIFRFTERPLPSPSPIFFNPHTGSCYQAVDAWGISWEDARRQASNMTLNGVPGHLATITSSDEQRFLEDRFGGKSNLWIGASDRRAEGKWEWVTGPESGTLFLEAVVTPVQKDNGEESLLPNDELDGLPTVEGTEHGFSRWYENEPNNLVEGEDSEGEDYAVWAWQSHGQWNDLCNKSNRSPAHGFLVEFSPRKRN